MTGPDESVPAAPLVSEMWQVHVYGPDEIFTFATKGEAMDHANEVNRLILEDRSLHLNDPNWPFSIAIVDRCKS